MANALKAINRRVKQLAKKHPNSKRSTLQKQAGREWKAGKLKAKRKPVAKKVASKKRRVSSVGKKPKVIVLNSLGAVIRKKRRAIRKAARARTAKRRVYGSKGSNLVPIIGIAALALIAYQMFKPSPINPQQYGYQPTSNVNRNTAASNILSYAMAAGLTVNAITQLINAINNSSDAKVINAGAAPSNQALNDLLSGN